MVSHSLVVGYHGCDIRVARKVISLKDSLHPSQNPWDWLGHGYYFWEDSPARAKRWAESESKRRGSAIKHPAVLAAVIDLGHCLNLADAESLKQVRAAYDEYERVCNSGRIEKAKNRGPDLRARYLDCAVMESLHQLRREEGKSPFDSVRGFFIEGRELYDNAGFRELDHIQVCVRSMDQIVGFFWPRQ
ncbi:MAG TPA: hypothetical protein VH280_16700 [Verrucomicrobiae bacterium]|jgi:hypothetical protein|nr:hypothetical protein [Verrucomicrobiae bacterium]